MTDETMTIDAGGLPSVARDLSATTTVLVSDAGVVAAGAVDVVKAAFGIEPILITLSPGEPTVSTVDETAKAVRTRGPRAVIAVGGGSVMDTTKIAAAIADSDQSTVDVLGGRGTLDRSCRLIAVPTTAGSGAEMTRIAVVTDDNGRKSWAWGDPLRPDTAVLIPELTAGCPPRLTVTSGLDALVHAFEAATSSRVDTSDPRALSAAATILETLPTVLAHPDDIEARAAMQRAASDAGAAINLHGTGLGHNIGHALATVHGMTHGFAVALGMAATIEWGIAGAAHRYRALAAHLEIDVDDLPARLDRLLRDVRYASHASPGAPVDIAAEQLAEVMASSENRPMRLNNARPAELEDLPGLAAATASHWRRLIARR